MISLLFVNGYFYLRVYFNCKFILGIVFSSTINKWIKKIKKNYHNAYGRQAWQSSDFPWELRPRKSLDALVTWSCKITWQTKNIPTIRVAMATTFDRIATWVKGFLPIKSHKALNMWSWKITWQTKIIIVPLPWSLWPWFSTHKVTWRLDHVFLQDHATD